MSFWEQIQKEMEQLSDEHASQANKDNAASEGTMKDERAKLCEMERERFRNQHKRLQRTDEREWDVKANREHEYSASNSGATRNAGYASNPWSNWNASGDAQQGQNSNSSKPKGVQ